MDTLEHTTIATTMIAGDIIGTATMAADGTTITVSAGRRSLALLSALSSKAVTREESREAAG